MSSTGKRFAEEFRQIGEVKLEDKVLIQDSEDGLVKYALVDQFNAAALEEFEDFLKGEDADEIINKWSELEKFLAGLKETDDLATILSEKFNTKDFTKEKILEVIGTSVNGPLTYNEAKDTWELKGNLVITKGLATYSTLENDGVLSIYDGLPIDNETLQWQETENGKILVAVGGGSGGGYATKEWVTNQKYFTQANFTKSNIKSTLGISDWALEATKPSYTFSEIASKPTTIAGYGITDAYTKKEIHELLPFTYDAKKDAWELDGNLIVTKGLATYTKLVGFTNLDVMGGIKVDRTSIYINDNGELAVVGGAGGGLDESALADYLTTNKYATQTWVTNQKYFTQANFTKEKIKEALGISDWALAASKPSYAWSEITSKPSYIFYSKNAIINPTDTTFRNVTGYAYSSQTDTVQGFGGTTGVWASFYSNNYIAQMQFNYSSAIPFVRVYDYSSSAWSDWKRIALHSTFDNYVPLATAKDITAIHNFVNGVKIGGKQITYDSAKNALVLPFNVILEGGLATYTKLSGFTNLDVMGGVVVDNETIAIVDGALKYIGSTGGGGSVSITGAASTIVSSNLTASRALISNSSGKVAVSAVTSTELGYLDGVTSAIQTQLNNKQATLVSGSNIKTINNQSILGSGNITISGGSGGGITLSDVADYLGDNGYVTRSSAGALANVSALTPSISGMADSGINIGSESLPYRSIYVHNLYPRKAYALRVYTSQSSTSSYVERLRVGASGKITVAWTNDNQTKEVFNVVGNIYTTGTVTESSARKMKDVDYEGEGIGLDVLKKVKVAKWHWKDKRDKKMHIGAIAEDLVEIIPEAVFDTQADDGSTTPSIAYGKAGFSIAASLIAPVSRHEDRIKELEKNIEKMQNELNKLKKSA